MISNTLKFRIMMGSVGLALGLGAAPAFGQVSCEWFGTGDGVSFEDTLNWLPNQLPGVLDEAKFDNAGSQTVNFVSSPTNAVASIENDSVVFNLAGQTYTTVDLIVGDRLVDVGSLTVNAGTLTTTTGLARLGRLDTSHGSLLVSNGAIINNQRDLIVGDEGSGYFQLDAGCSAMSLITFLGDEIDSSGVALIRGTWTIQTGAVIGNAGSGNMTVDSGGDVSAGHDTLVGDELGADGSLTIDGAGSTFTCTAPTTIGNFGTGSLVVSNGGTLTTAQLKIADDAAASVLVDAGTIIDSVGTGVGNRAAGSLTLANGGMVQSPLVTVVALGTLSGSGTIDGPLLNDGQLNPGSSAGALVVTGDFTQSLGTLNIEIGGPAAGTQYDQLTVSGLSTLGGTLNVSLINGYNPSSGEFVIVQGGTVSGAFVVENLPPGFAIAYEAGRVVVSIGNSCVADMNGDGMLNGIDVGLFLQAYSTGNLAADMNGDGMLNGLDVGLFLQAYSTGCA